MAQWTERSIMSCGHILKYQYDVVEYKCSKCNRWALDWVRSNEYEYCPNCGERMENAGLTIKDCKRGNE